MKLICPSCSAEIQFSSSVALYCVCSFCRSQIFRNEQQIELLGKQAELPEDLSPIQLFSEGEFNGKKFKVLGKVKMQWSEGVWNEWFLNCSDGSIAWLAEAQGKWIFSIEKKDLVIPDRKQIILGETYKLEGAVFTYADMKDAISYGFEGELPFLTVKDAPRFSVDLLCNKTNRFLSFEFDSGGKRAYLGMYVTLAQLKMTNLRGFDGWSA